MHCPLSPLEIKKKKAGLLCFCFPPCPPPPLTTHPRSPASTLSPIPSPPPGPFAPAQNRSARDLVQKGGGRLEPGAPYSSAPRRWGQEATAALGADFPLRARTMAFFLENEVRRRLGTPRGPSRTPRTSQVRSRAARPSSAKTPPTANAAPSPLPGMPPGRCPPHPSPGQPRTPRRPQAAARSRTRGKQCAPRPVPRPRALIGPRRTRQPAEALRGAETGRCSGARARGGPCAGGGGALCAAAVRGAAGAAIGRAGARAAAWRS